MGFLRAIVTTKTGVVGLLAALASLAGLLPFIDLGFNPELLVLGIGLMTIRHTLYKQDIRQFDPILDKLLGDRLSGISQDVLIELLDAQERQEEGGE